MRTFGRAMNMPAVRLSIDAILALAVARVLPADAQLQTLKKEPEAHQLDCGQKVLVENQSCPSGQILEVTGSCLNEKEAPGTLRRGRQFNCIPRKK